MTQNRVGKGSVVAVFYCADEKSATIECALQLVRANVPDVRPLVVMIDKSSAEAKAVRAVWPDCSLRICRFHAIQAWTRCAALLRRTPHNSHAPRLQVE